MTIAIDRLDHLVLTVRDMDATCSFYNRVLGMERRTFGDNRTALYFGRQKLNLHDAAKPVDPNVRHAAPGSSAHISHMRFSLAVPRGVIIFPY